MPLFTRDALSLQGFDLSDVVPTGGDILTWNGTIWVAQAATGSSYRRDINAGVLVTTGNASKVDSNGFSALELQNGQTSFGIWSNVWRRTPTTSVTVKIQFKLKTAGTGTFVRVAIKYKARSPGEDTSTAFDEEAFASVTVTPGSPDDIYEGIVVLDEANFIEGDAVGMSIGRDGNNDFSGPGDSDDFNKRIHILAFELEVI